MYLLKVSLVTDSRLFLVVKEYYSTFRLLKQRVTHLHAKEIAELTSITELEKGEAINMNFVSGPDCQLSQFCKLNNIEEKYLGLALSLENIDTDKVIYHSALHNVEMDGAIGRPLLCNV